MSARTWEFDSPHQHSAIVLCGMKLSFSLRRQAIEGTIESVTVILAGDHGPNVRAVVLREWLNGDDRPENIRKFASRFVKENMKEFESLLDRTLKEEILSGCGPVVRRLVRDQDFGSSILPIPTIHRPIAKR